MDVSFSHFTSHQCRDVGFCRLGSRSDSRLERLTAAFHPTQAVWSACSYQLPATLAVLSTAAVATGESAVLLTWLFLAYLLVTTLIYLRLTSGSQAHSSLNVLMTPSRRFMQRPTVSALWREAWGTVRQSLLHSIAGDARLHIDLYRRVAIGSCRSARLGFSDSGSIDEFVRPSRASRATRRVRFGAQRRNLPAGSG
jgi:hypothetical protein